MKVSIRSLFLLLAAAALAANLLAGVLKIRKSEFELGLLNPGKIPVAEMLAAALEQTKLLVDLQGPLAEYEKKFNPELERVWAILDQRSQLENFDPDRIACIGIPFLSLDDDVKKGWRVHVPAGSRIDFSVTCFAVGTGGTRTEITSPDTAILLNPSAPFRSPLAPGQHEIELFWARSGNASAPGNATIVFSIDGQRVHSISTKFPVSGYSSAERVSGKTVFQPETNRETVELWDFRPAGESGTSNRVAIVLRIVPQEESGQ